MEKADGAGALDRLVDCAFGEADGRGCGGVVAAEEAELKVRIVAAVADGAVQDDVADWDSVGFVWVFGLQESAEFGLELGG